jgi:DnaJ-class molecular chaperone
VNPVAKKRDYYDVLGLARTASDKEIRATYKTLAKKYHPDFNPDDKKAEEKFKHVSEAYAVLSNPEARRKFDTYGHQGPGQGGFDFSGFDFRNMQGGFSSQGETYFGSFGDVLSEMLGGGRGRQRQARRRPAGGFGFNNAGGGGFGGAPPPREVRLKLTIDFLLAARGGVTQIHLSHGGGNEQISTRIPAGVGSGQTIRLKGKAPGGGDLLLEVEVESHPVFSRDGLNLKCTVPITIAEAVLGGQIRVPTLDGEATIKIPPGTQGGQTLRLRGRGVRRDEKNKGDLLATFQIAVPKEVNDKSKALIQSFDKENPLHPRADLDG